MQFQLIKVFPGKLQVFQQVILLRTCLKECCWDHFQLYINKYLRRIVVIFQDSSYSYRQEKDKGSNSKKSNWVDNSIIRHKLVASNEDYIQISNEYLSSKDSCINRDECWLIFEEIISRSVLNSIFETWIKTNLPRQGSIWL